MTQYRSTGEYSDKTLMLRTQEFKERVAANGGELDYARGFGIVEGYLMLTLPDNANPSVVMPDFYWIPLVPENTVQTKAETDEVQLEQ